MLYYAWVDSAVDGLGQGGNGAAMLRFMHPPLGRLRVMDERFGLRSVASAVITPQTGDLRSRSTTQGCGITSHVISREGHRCYTSECLLQHL
jgi:hypothetical protein